MWRKAQAGIRGQWNATSLLALLLAFSGFVLLWNRMATSLGATLILLLHIVVGICVAPRLSISLYALYRTERQRFLSLTALLCGTSGLWLAMRPLFGMSNGGSQFALSLHLCAALLTLGAWAMFAGKALSKPQRALLLSLLSLLSFPALLFVSATPVLPYSSETYLRDLSATNATQAKNSLFPAGVQMNNPLEEGKPRWKEATANYCGRSGCHEAAYHEWNRSAHRFAGEDPFYLRVKRAFITQKGEAAARYCAGCHEPRSLLATENTAQNSGVDCVACHAIATDPQRTGNGRYTLALEETYPFASAEAGWKRALHTYLIRARPSPHKAAFAKPNLQSSAEFCATCHRQSLSVAQNHYQFVRTVDNYGEWRQGATSNQSARTTPEPNRTGQTCQSCHFARKIDGGVAHNSLGSNLALPALRNDTEHLSKTEAFMQNRLAIDLFALRRTRPSRQEDWFAPLDNPLEMNQPRPGDPVTLEVVVENQHSGHDFPSGYADLKTAFLEVRLRDPQGRVLLENGVVANYGEIPPQKTHLYRLSGLDRAGNPIIRNNRADQLALLAKRTIPAGGVDIARYVFTLPKKDGGGKPLQGSLSLEARLRYTPLPPDFVQWAVAGTKRSAKLPIITLAERRIKIDMQAYSTSPSRYDSVRRDSKPRVETASDTANRFVKYAWGLLAPKENPELQRALRAFRIAQSLAPQSPDSYIGMGTAYLREPDLLAARSQFEQALRLAPSHPQARFGLALVYAKQGSHTEALALFDTLAKGFPNDSELQREIGAVQYQQGDYVKAVQSFQNALTLDPDDPKAHYQLKLCYQRLHRIPEARTEEAIGRYHAENRWQNTLVAEHLRLNPQSFPFTRPIPTLPLTLPKKQNALPLK